jgi:hypothetical protein
MVPTDFSNKTLEQTSVIGIIEFRHHIVRLASSVTNINPISPINVKEIQ